MTRTPTKGNVRRRRRPVVVVALVVGVIVVLAVVAGLVAWQRGALGRRAGIEETRPVQVSGADLPTLPDGVGPFTDPAHGRPMPEIRGAAFDGTPVAITNDGHPKVVLFLAHWCPHCQNEVPKVAAWAKSGGVPAGVEMYSVSTAVQSSRPNYPPSTWLGREGWPLPVIADDRHGRAAEAVGLSAFPFFVFVGADGTVRGRGAGEIEIDQLKELVAALARS